MEPDTKQNTNSDLELSKLAELESLKSKVKALESEVAVAPKSVEQLVAKEDDPTPEVKVAPEKESVIEAESVNSMVTPINFANMDDNDDDQTAQQDDDDLTQALPKDDLEAQVQTLVKVALTGGIEQAIDNALKLNNPYVMDELHDTLVDHLYEQLVRMRKIEKE